MEASMKEEASLHRRPFWNDAEPPYVLCIAGPCVKDGHRTCLCGNSNMHHGRMCFGLTRNVERSSCRIRGWGAVKPQPLAQLRRASG